METHISPDNGCPVPRVYPQSGVRETKSSTDPDAQAMGSPTAGQVTRLAPSPTGALHLGNAFAFVINWALARKQCWRIALRIEDLDTPRVKPGVIGQTIRTLEWLGLDWDFGPTTQAENIEKYQQAMEQLATKGLVYPCELTRSQIEQAASAPHVGDEDHHETRFDPSLRPSDRAGHAGRFEDLATNWRLMVEPGEIGFVDGHMGVQAFDLDQIVGDFVVWTKRGTPSYQLAVVVDDAQIGVTQVVRGNDLLDSAARQLLIYRGLGLDPEPRYTHLPLIRGMDGRRLAKRHGDTRIDSYTQSGVSRERIIGLLAFWSGLSAQREEMSIGEFLAGCSLDTLPRHDLVFTPEDDAWLRG